MGCDIHSYAEVRDGDAWAWVRSLPPDTDYQFERDEVFRNRNYGLFGFLADVRNYSHSPVIAETRGLPDDVSAELRADYDEWEGMAHSTSWLTLAELLAYDYDQVFWDRRITREGNGAALAEDGEGRWLTLRDFLGEWFFERLNDLARLGDPEDVRIVFWFDN